MRTIIAGSRFGATYHDVAVAVAFSGFALTTILSGSARGVARLGEHYAEANLIPLEKYPAESSIYGRQAPYVRNEEMVANAEALIALWDGKSRGTKHMIDVANRNDLKVYVHNILSSNYQD